MLTRKPALAAAMALTAILGFAVVAFGAQRGIFAWTQGTQSEAARQTVDAPPEENPLAGWPAATPAVIEIQPVQVVTEYQVTDQVVPAPPVQQMAAAPTEVPPTLVPTAPAPTAAAPTARAAATAPAQSTTRTRTSDDSNEGSGARDGGGHEGGGDD